MGRACGLDTISHGVPTAIRLPGPTFYQNPATGAARISAAAETTERGPARANAEERMAYPVVVDVTPALTNRNRLTTLFRAVLAIPHIFLVGGVGITVATRSDGQTSAFGESGVLGAVAITLAFVSWITLVFAGSQLPFIRHFTAFYLRWRVRAIAYIMLLEDRYPPFADAPYPATLTIVEPAGPRPRLSIAFRLIYAIPHFVVLALLLFVWGLATVVAWFVILFTGSYPKALVEFAVGVLRWRLRVEAYTLLMVDDYPPFSLE